MLDVARQLHDRLTFVQGEAVAPRGYLHNETTTVTLSAHARRGLIASEASLLHELAGAFLWYIYIKYQKTFKNEQRNRVDTAKEKELIQVE